MHTHLPRVHLRSDPAECTCGFKIFENRGTLPALPGSVPATSVITSGSCVGTGKGNGDRLAEEIPERSGIPVASAHAGSGMGGPVHGATGLVATATTPLIMDLLYYLVTLTGNKGLMTGCCHSDPVAL